MYDLFRAPAHLQTVPIYGGALPGGASYQVVFVYGAAPSLWLRLRHCTGMAKKNMSDEDEAFWFDECRILPELGKLLRSVPENNFQRAEQLIVAYRYLAYDFDQPFLPQYRDNMLFLKAMLEKLA